MIIAGRITVNRLPAEVGQKVGPGDEVRINGELVKVRFTEPRPRILMYHKPTGEIVTRDDPEGRPTVFEKLPNIGNGKWINVGRLDYNTEGLMLFTNSGELANRLMHPRYEVEREYAVRIMGRLSDEQMHKLTAGVDLEDGPAKCESVVDGGGEEEGANHWYHVVLKEGRNREVRRLFEALGLTVSRLIRTRYGTLSMPSVMKRADTLELEPAEVAAVMDSAGLKAQGGPPGQQRPGGSKNNRGRHQNGRPKGQQGQQVPAQQGQSGQPGAQGQPRQPGQPRQHGQQRHQGKQRQHGQPRRQGTTWAARPTGGAGRRCNCAADRRGQRRGATTGAARATSAGQARRASARQRGTTAGRFRWPRRRARTGRRTGRRPGAITAPATLARRLRHATADEQRQCLAVRGAADGRAGRPAWRTAWWTAGTRRIRQSRKPQRTERASRRRSRQWSVSRKQWRGSGCRQRSPSQGPAWG